MNLCDGKENVGYENAFELERMDDALYEHLECRAAINRAEAEEVGDPETPAFLHRTWAAAHAALVAMEEDDRLRIIELPQATGRTYPLPAFVVVDALCIEGYVA